MPLTTYAELQAAIADWLERADLATRIPDFITLFEAAANRRLRVREQEAAATLAPSSGTAALPADYLAWRRVTWAGARRVELDYVHPSYLQAAWPSSPSGVPRVFTIEGAVLKIRPVEDTALELDYFRKISVAGVRGELAVRLPSRPLPVRRAGGRAGLRARSAGGRDVEGAARRNLRRDREAQQQDPRHRRGPGVRSDAIGARSGIPGAAQPLRWMPRESGASSTAVGAASEDDLRIWSGGYWIVRLRGR